MQAWLYVHSNVSAMCLVDVTVATKFIWRLFPMEINQPKRSRSRVGLEGEPNEFIQREIDLRRRHSRVD